MLDDKQPQLTSLDKLGEFGLIDHLTNSIEIQNDTTEKGIGDDAAVLNLGELETVVTTDMLVEGVHFNLAYVPLKHLGYKSVMVNLSDVYAMNAVPSQILVSIAVSSRFPVEALEELYEGIKIACKNYKVDLVGGDTTSSTSGLIISITAIGTAKKQEIVYRDGANENDLLVVSGDLGGAYLGLQVLERENEVFKVNPNVQPDLAQYDYLVGRQLKPEARKDIVQLLKDLEVKPTSMIDISDGLSSEILHLSKQSGYGFKIYEEKIPLDPSVIKTAEEFSINPVTCALNGGEDYELLFTISQEDYPKIKGNPNLTVIGHTTEQNAENYLMLQGSESAVPLSAQGWNSFEGE
ncbi:thiamine-phosphate kinase [Moheibacter lacus]|uniref:Thiamine-monophosphate kinase n=1 Tax=Moheibacter lacus TaxID=2745851 RepID=A0A838ZM28_9FLAO|nr:thiamine-phosphate kinase [Moheibacter lacus]MBA5628820.1 thiamine-phosphate kinase [Moheibacter lacus]